MADEGRVIDRGLKKRERERKETEGKVVESAGNADNREGSGAEERKKKQAHGPPTLRRAGRRDGGMKDEWGRVDTEGKREERNKRQSEKRREN